MSKMFPAKEGNKPAAFARRTDGDLFTDFKAGNASKQVFPVWRRTGRRVANRIARAFRCGQFAHAGAEQLESRVLLAAHIVGSSTVYSTIQAAVNAAVAGNVINVDAGTYSELVTINKSLTIRGAQAGVDARRNTRQSGANESVVNLTSGAGSGFNITANDVTLDGFTVQGNAGVSTSEAGIVIGPNLAGAHILNNIVANNVAGMYLANSSATDPAVMRFNVFSLNNQPGDNGGRGIYTDETVFGSQLTNVTIDSNAFWGNQGSDGTTGYEAAIAIQPNVAGISSNIRITNNVMDANGKAVLFFHTTGVTITGNYITNTLDQWSGTLRFEGDDSNITIQNNTVYDNTGPGVAIDSKGVPGSNSGFVVSNNNFYNNSTVWGSKISAIVTASNYTGTFDTRNNWWGNSSGPSGDGPGSGDAVWGNGSQVTGSQWSTAPGGSAVWSPWSTTPNGAEEAPYWGVPFAVASPIQAADFNHGGQNIAYHTTSSNDPGQYRPNESIGIENTSDAGGGYDVTSTVAGEWLDYTISVPITGTYRLDVRLANAQSTGGKFHATIDGTNVTGTINVPNTGGSQTWQTISSVNFSVSAGQHVLKLLLDTNGSGGEIANFHWLKLTTISAPAAVPSAPSNLLAFTMSTSQVFLTWDNTATNQTGFEIDRSTNGTSFSPIGNVAANVTSYADTGLSAGTSYFYRVEATDSTGSSAASNIASAVTAAVNPVTYLSDLSWVSATTGYGTIHKDLSINGNPITLRGTVYPKGIGTHAVSQIVYNLGGQYQSFASDVGVDDEVAPNSGSVDFQVIGDGTVLYDSGALTNASPIAHINVSVSGVQQLTLVANNGVAGIDFDHADWAGARLIAGAQATPVFSGLSASATITYGAATTTLSGTIAAGTLIPQGNVSITINGSIATAAINAATGAFSVNFDTHAIPASATAYTITYSYAGNANFNSASDASKTLTVNKRTLNVTATGQNKTYDASANATVTLSDNRVNNDSLAIAYASAAFTNKTVGTAKTVSVTGITMTGAAAGNYTLANTTASTTANITTRTLTVTATGQNKTYDGNTTATVTLSDNRVSGDVLTDNFTSATFANKNVGTGKTVSVSGISITGTDAANYTLSATTASTTANITVRTLTVTATGQNKTYDGNTTATVTLSDNRVSGDVLTDSSTGATFANKNVGTGKTVSVSGISITGTDAANYTLSATTASTTANITVRTLTVSATGQNKTYDGNTTATVTLSDNRVSGDVLTDSSTSATFANKNVGTGKTVSVSGISITGTDAANYSLAATTASTTANITVRTLTVSATGQNKTYDGNTTATVTLSDNRVSGDVLTDSSTSATFANKNVGTGKTVSVTGISITGTDAGNYSLSTTTASTTANITVRTLTVSATGQNKTYDGNTTAIVTLSDNRVSGDVLTDTSASATFANKNVGTGKTISVSGISISGTDAANYSLAATTASTTANITVKTLTVTATGQNKIYDGNTTATVTLSDNRISGDVLTDNSTSATFADKNVGTSKTVSVSGISITGTDAANYSLSATTASTTANITVRTLTVSATGQNKTYDGNTTATVTLSDSRVSGDVLTDNSTSATFADKNVGTGKTISVTGIGISGTDAANYALSATTASTAANIASRTLTVSATGQNKTYDGNTTATVTLSDNRVSGDVLTDSSTSATFADKNVGTGKTVSVSGISITGTDAANYSLAATTASTTANITVKTLTVTATGQNKIYDGNTTATVTLSDNRVSGDVLDVAFSSATFSDSNVANGKTVTVNGLSVGGTDAGNYTFSLNVSTTANITPELIINGASAADSITLVQDADHAHIDWFLNPGGAATFGQLATGDLSGLTIAGNGGADTITLDYTNGSPLPATLHLNGTFTLDGLQGSPGAPGLANTTLEIGRSTLLISYPDSVSDPIASIKTALQNGYNNGAWTGTPTASIGAITSTVAANNPNHNTAIGYVDSADGTGYNNAANTIELQYALYGDVNLDGSVNFLDFSAVAANYNVASVFNWDQGGVDYSGSVNFNTLSLLAANYNTNLGSQATPTGATLPTTRPVHVPYLPLNSSGKRGLSPSIWAWNGGAIWPLARRVWTLIATAPKW